MTMTMRTSLDLDIPCSLWPAVAMLELTGNCLTLALPVHMVSVELDCGWTFLWCFSCAEESPPALGVALDLHPLDVVNDTVQTFFPSQFFYLLSRPSFKCLILERRMDANASRILKRGPIVAGPQNQIPPYRIYCWQYSHAKHLVAHSTCTDELRSWKRCYNDVDDKRGPIGAGPQNIIAQ